MRAIKVDNETQGMNSRGDESGGKTETGSKVQKVQEEILSNKKDFETTSRHFSGFVFGVCQLACQKHFKDVFGLGL